jgi:hypothetical protein
MKKSVKETKRKNHLQKKTKKSKSRTLKNTKGGTNYSIGETKEKNGFVESQSLSDQFNGLSNNIGKDESLPFFHFTNLEKASTCSNKDPNFTYHSLFLSYIDGNINDLDVINWSIHKFLNDLLIKINKENDVNKVNKVVCTINDLKINDFKFEFNLDKKAIILTGNVYITNVKKLKNQIDNKLNDRLNTDVTNNINDFIHP